MAYQRYLMAQKNTGWLLSIKHLPLQSLWAQGLFVGLFLLLLLFTRIAVSAYTNRLGHIPGPRYTLWTGLWLKVNVLRGRRLHYIHELHQKYGDFVRISPSEIAVNSVPAFRTIHKPGSGFVKSDWYLLVSQSLTEPGIFALTDPQAHADRRRLFAQPFSNTTMMKYEDVVRSKAHLAVSKIARDAALKDADILKWFTFLATDVIGQLSFGRSFEALQREKKNDYIRDLEVIVMFLGIRAELVTIVDFFSAIPYSPLGSMANIRSRFHTYGRQAVKNHKEHLATLQDLSTLTPSLFSKFLDPCKNSELSEDVVTEEAGNFIVAGSDTTASTLTYMVWAILRPEHSQVRARLMAELDTVPVDLPLTDIVALPYFNCVLQEVLRLYGAAPGSLPRVVPVQGVEFDGYFLSPKTVVSTQAYSIHRKPDIYEDPERFIPERWENPSQQMKDAFCPFGVGPRTCIGIHLAYMELRLASFLFFKTCPTAQLSPLTTDASMEFENFFLVAPKAHECKIFIPQLGGTTVTEKAS